MNSVQYVRAVGGIGNRLNILATAVANNYHVYWASHTESPHYTEIFESFPTDIFTITDDMRDRFNQQTWLFPNIDHTKLGTPDHYPNHEIIPISEYNQKYWARCVFPGKFNISQLSRFKFHPQYDPPKLDRIGIHLRLLHPRIHTDINQVTSLINEVGNKIPNLLVVSDKKLDGISSHIDYQTADMKFDADRHDHTTTMQHWAALRSCKTIYRNSYTSTFTSWHCFVDGITMKPIVALHELL